jgi:hypothetical protein
MKHRQVDRGEHPIVVRMSSVPVNQCTDAENFIWLCGEVKVAKLLLLRENQPRFHRLRRKEPMINASQECIK